MIKKFISKLFGIKQCKCPEDEHIEYYTKVLEPEITKWKCGTHSRFKKSCPICKEIAGEI